MSTTCLEKQQGFGLIAAIVILVILAALGGYVVSLTRTQNLTSALDIQGAKALQAAKAGIEYGLSEWFKNPASSAVCPDVTTPVALPGLEFSFILDGEQSGRFCTLTAIAWPTGMPQGSTGSPGYIERRIRTIAEAKP